jgi:TctA family transporter
MSTQIPRDRLAATVAITPEMKAAGEAVLVEAFEQYNIHPGPYWLPSVAAAVYGAMLRERPADES